MKKLLIFICVPMMLFSQEIQYSKPNYYDVPLSQNHKNVIDIYTWYDVLGKNTLIFTAKEGCGDGYDYCDLRAYHYTGNGNLLWDIKDYAPNKTDIRRKKTKITDLDDDGVAEISILYTLGYRGSGVKLIMHEKGKKYAIRGERWERTNDDCAYSYSMYGKNSFESARSSFKSYAKNLFLKEINNLKGDYCDHYQD
tara:strand:- start:623 stop:1210 length:588 start_codon:yes stop_codon:yes gene_type:complete